ncbi:hypothetical protein [Micromonospora sp. H61]|uniref:hypothetical protein n=1 Tax=Micromonospora sp. H61 TaxID=2824888 RepID=UPI001FFD4EA7|nr:hypothetical protein [Micromonospora sp. H61]
MPKGVRPGGGRVAVVRIVNRPEKHPEVGPCAERKIGVEHHDRDVFALLRLRGTLEGQVKPMRRPGDEPSMVGALASLNRVSHDDCRSTIGGVKHAADGMV